MTVPEVRDLQLTQPVADAPHLLDSGVVADGLGVEAAGGLTDEQVTTRLAEYGPNRLTEQPPRAAWKVFGDQLRSGLFLILLVAAALAALVGDVKDAAIIGVVVLLNATIGFTQERKATRSLAALKQLLVVTGSAMGGSRIATGVS